MTMAMAMAMAMVMVMVMVMKEYVEGEQAVASNDEGMENYEM